MALRLQAGTDEFLQQDGTDKLLLQDESAGGVEITASPGAGLVTIAGAQAVTEAEQVISVGDGSVVISGQSALTDAEQIISVGAGTLVVTGESPVADAEQIIPTGVGFISIDGGQALASVPEATIQAGSGSVLINSNVVTLSVTNPVTEKVRPQTYSGGKEDLIQQRLREDEELLMIIAEFVKAA